MCGVYEHSVWKRGFDAHIFMYLVFHVFTIFHVYFYPYFDMAMGFIDLVVYGVITK